MGFFFQNQGWRVCGVGKRFFAGLKDWQCDEVVKSD